MKQLTISGYSTALFSTWYFIEEAGVLFDAGDGVTAALLQKSRKVNHIFISHADRDHLTGLLQLNQLNARDGLPVICYPRDSKSFPALAEFISRFDAYANGSVWMPVSPGDEIRIHKDMLVIPLRNEHVRTEKHITRSLGYQLIETKRKLKPELAGLSNAEIARISLEHGKESTTTEVRTTILSYSGDTPVADPSTWDGSRTLIHEATFLGGEEDIPVHAHKNLHSRLEEVMEMVSGITIEQLILGHFSSRYDAAEIDRAILSLCDKYGIQIPVFRVLPGETVKDILRSSPVNK
ncbi:RNAse Z [Chitinophaga sp. Mgbs1]|uniref:RNAse Z n=1 Tax=Chitinophaga solisilvae TaxID=1233460 RepID=A0A433WKL1_9BACT|nr:RNAse Z [Chitinophaga solisilvae]